MVFQYASGLHLEMKENEEFVEDGALEVVGDVLLLAGDNLPMRVLKPQYERFLDWISSQYAHVIMVPGRVELPHRCDCLVLGKSWRMMLRENVGLYYNYRIPLGDSEVYVAPSNINDSWIRALVTSSSFHRIILSYNKPGPALSSRLAQSADYWVYGEEASFGEDEFGLNLASNHLGYVGLNQHMQGFSICKYFEIE